MNSTFALVCLGLITLGLWVGLAALFVALLQLKRTLQAVEVLTYRLTESAEKMQNVSAQINSFADNVRSGWMKTLEMAIGAAQTFWTRRSEPEVSSSKPGNGKK